MTEGPVRTVAVIGLGIMGAPMAANLVTKGFEVTAFSRSRAPGQRLAERGGKVSDSIAGAVSGADAVVTMLPDGPAVAEVVLGPGGVLSSAGPGTVLADMSTIDLATTRLVHESCLTKGIGMLDAPVSGGEAGAIEGTLSVMAGGRPEDFARMEPVFAAVGTSVALLGPSGTGQVVKAANQLLVGGTLTLVAEAIVFLEANGIAVGPALEVLNGGLAASRVLERRGPAMAEREFRPGFRVDLHHKDLGILVDAARAAGVSLPLGSLTAQLFGALRARGHGGSDHTAIISVLEALAGRATSGLAPVPEPSPA